MAAETPLHVVVIDDEPDAVITLLELLRDEGHRADGFAAGTVALDAIPGLDPDVIICDIAMPAPNGWEVAKQVRAMQHGGKVPLMIAISGRFTKGADRVLAQISGFDFFVTKPCEPELLLALVGRPRPA